VEREDGDRGKRSEVGGQKSDDSKQQVNWEIRELENWGIGAFEN
jgi:hypothetical protein